VPFNVNYMWSPAPLHSAVYGRRAVTPGPDYAYSYSTDYATALPDYAYTHRNILSRNGRPSAKKLHFYTRNCLCQLEVCSKLLASSIRMKNVVRLASGLYSTDLTHLIITSAPPSPWIVLGRIVEGMHRPSYASSEGRIVRGTHRQGTNRLRDASSEGRII
jgi:hypothetical protein